MKTCMETWFLRCDQYNSSFLIYYNESSNIDDSSEFYTFTLRGKSKEGCQSVMIKNREGFTTSGLVGQPLLVSRSRPDFGLPFFVN